MCEACDAATPQQRREVLDAFSQAVCRAAGGGEIVMMPKWLSNLERGARRRANRHDLDGNRIRCGIWDVMTGVPFLVDDIGRNLGLIKDRKHPTLGDALDASNPGDVIVVYPGDYREPIIYPNGGKHGTAS